MEKVNKRKIKTKANGPKWVKINQNKKKVLFSFLIKEFRRAFCKFDNEKFFGHKTAFFLEFLYFLIYLYLTFLFIHTY